MTTPVQKAADVAAAFSVPAWIVSLAVEALPLVQFCAGILAIIASIFAIAVNWKKLRGRQQ